MNSSCLAGNATNSQSLMLHYFIPSLLAIIFIVGFFLNGASLWIFFFRIRKWNTGMVLQFNLALSDSIITIAAPLMVTIFFLGTHWSLENFLCQLNIFLLSSHLYGSIYFLTIISIHRYMAIVHYYKKSLFTRKSFMIKMCMATWLILVLQGCVSYVLRTSVAGSTAKCLNIIQTEMTQLLFYWNMLYLIPSFLVPFGTSLACYVLLGVYICRMNTNSLMLQAMRAKTIHIIALSLSIYIICFVPIHVSISARLILKYLSPGCDLLRIVEIACYASWVFTAASCCLDPLLYMFSTEVFYQSFTWMTRHIKCKSRCPPLCFRKVTANDEPM